MTEEEEIEYLKSVEDATEEYFRLQGFPIDMSEMSTEELEGFFLNLPSVHQTGYRDYVSLVTKGNVPSSDPFDIGVEAMMPLTIWGIPVPAFGLAKNPLKWGKNLVGKGFKWLDRLIGSADEVGDVARAAPGRPIPGVGGGPPFRDARGRFRPNPSSGRTTSGLGTPAPGFQTPGMIADHASASLRFGPATSAMGATAAAVGAYEGVQYLGSDESPDLPEESTNLDAYREQQGILDTSDMPSEQLLEAVAGDPNILKQIIYKDISEQAAFDKMTNWVGKKGIRLIANGQSLYDALKEQETVLGAMKLYDLRNEDHREVVVNYFIQNADSVDAIKNAVAADHGRRGGLSVEDAANDYVDQIAATSPNMALLPNNADGSAIGIITTFDGTAHGTIESLNDLTSGGKIGHLNLLPFLENARPEQLVMWQQELYSWGYLTRPPEVWGQLTNDSTGVPPTLAAAHQWQVEVFNMGSVLQKEGIEITKDGTPRADRVLDSVIAQRAAYTQPKTTDDKVLKDQVVGQAQKRVETYLTATGRYLPTGAVEQLKHGLTRELGKLSPSQSEELFGQGGSRRERLLAENMLREFYGVDDWGSMLMIGDGRTEKFYDYASMVGAVSEDERRLLEAGGSQRRNYDPGLQNRDVNEAQQDVAVAALLKFLSDEGSAQDIMGMDVNDLVNALNVYTHTIGSSRGMTRNFTQRELIEMSSRALTNTQQAIFQPDNTAQRVADDYVDSAGIGGGIAGYNYREIVNELNRVASSPGYLRTRNV